jgi:hypothetical protein
LTLLDANEEPHSKIRRYILTGVALAILLGLGLWYSLRFISEKHTVQHFMDAVVAGNFQQGYQLWKSHGSYTYGDFLSDWGPRGYYGPVQSYRVESTVPPRNGGSGIIVVVEISPLKPFPDDKDPQSRRNREVRLWVERSDQSISFPP